MVKLFKDQELLVADTVDRQGDVIPREVLEKAVREAQSQIDEGVTLLISKRFSKKPKDVQGFVTEIRMEGNKAVIDGTLLDSDPGLAAQQFPDVEYAAGGIAKPELDGKGHRVMKELTINRVSAVPPGVKVK
jgi:hypothetical protein